MPAHSKPILLAFCGKSATGKDSTIKWLHNQFNGMDIPNRVIISDTTRPPRVGEKNGIDYYFVSEEDFIRNLNRDKYLEWTCFRGWYYGTHKAEIDSGMILMGVFNSQGIKTLRKQYSRVFTIIPIYLEDGLFVRLNRSREREGRWRFEFFRRIFADWVDFRGIKKVIKSFRYYIILKNEVGVMRRARAILFDLQQFNII